MRGVPGFSRYRYARGGAVGADGKLPQGWALENLTDVSIDDIDLGPQGPAITVTLRAGADNPAPYVSIVVGDYLPAPVDEAVVLRAEIEVLASAEIAAGYAIVREWIAGGEYVGQTTRPIAMAAGAQPIVAARIVGGESRLLQPVLSLKRTPGIAASATIRVRRMAMASLYAHPGWLADPAG